LVSGIAVPLGHVLVRMRAGCQGVSFTVAGRGFWETGGSLWPVLVHDAFLGPPLDDYWVCLQVDGRELKMLLAAAVVAAGGSEFRDCFDGITGLSILF
jgi:hypothetical protein